MNQRERIEALKRIAAKLEEIDRQLAGLCPFVNRAAVLNNERIRLANEARELTRGHHEA